MLHRVDDLIYVRFYRPVLDRVKWALRTKSCPDGLRCLFKFFSRSRLARANLWLTSSGYDDVKIS